MVMQHHLKDAINVIVMGMVMNNLIFVIPTQENVIVNIIPKETIVNFVKKGFLEIQSNYKYYILLSFKTKNIFTNNLF